MMSAEHPEHNFSDTPTIINAATVKLPVFTSCDPFTWFVRIEAQFRSKNILRSQTKSDYVLQALPESVCTRIAAFLRKNPTDIDYDDLKSEILKKYSLTSSERVQKVLEIICQPLGDRTPSGAWDEISTLLKLPETDAFGDLKEIDLQRELWLLHLPEPVRAGLYDSASLTIDELLKKADDLQISHRAAIRRSKNDTPFIASILSKCLRHKHEEPRSDNDIDFQSPSRATAATVARRPFSNRPNQRDASYRYRAEPRNDRQRHGYLTPSGYCNYHAKWGDKAFSCVPGCTWRNYPKNEGRALQLGPKKV